MSGDGRLVVSGGGRTAVDPPALAAAGAELAGLAAALGQLALAAAGRLADPVLVASAALSPATWWRAEVALARVGGAGGAPALAGRLASSAAALQGCAAAYAAAEAAVLAGRWAAGYLAGRAAPVVLPAAVAAGAALALADAARHAGAVVATLPGVGGPGTPGEAADALAGAPAQVAARVGADARAVGREAGEWLAAHPGAVDAAVLSTPGALEGLMAAVPGLGPAVAAATGSGLPAVDARGAARVLVGVGLLGPVLRETGVRVTRATAGPAAPTRPPRGVAELVDGVVRQAAGRVPTSDPRGYPGRSPLGGTPPAQGQVRVERITGPGGGVSWVVLVPGTQEWSPVTGNRRPAMDLTANLHSVAGHRTAPMRIVVEALRASGARHGEPVLLAGHSQGGLTAVELAADEEVRSEFTVTHVVTAGSPVAMAEVPPQVQVLSLEHSEDLVTVLDGADNPDTPSWTTVRRDLADDPRWSQRVGADGLAAHDSLAYADTAELVDASGEEALRRWSDSARAFWDRPGARVEVHDFRGERLVA
ncbi:hypothetical protein, partial [Kineococcus sp. NUM-3379]